MLKVGFVGWRGMVGSVLRERMLEENDFKGFEPTFFTTSNIGGKGPDIGLDHPLLFRKLEVHPCVLSILPVPASMPSPAVAAGPAHLARIHLAGAPRVPCGWVRCGHILHHTWFARWNAPHRG